MKILTTSLYFHAVICFFFSVTLQTYGQKLIESRQTSYYTYIYKITDKEANKIYKKNIWIADNSFFHTLVDSFPTDSLYNGKLKAGHYLRAFTKKDQLDLSVTTVQDFDVFILNNNTDLCVQVYDLQGKMIRDADVRVDCKKLRFNRKAQYYLDRKSNQKGLLQVTYNGFTAYFDLVRQYNNSFIKRGFRKAVYNTPLVYAWLPVDYVISLPVDGVKSIVHHGARGSIYRTRNFFVRAYEKVACLFDDYYCNDYNSSYRFDRKHPGYIVFNKPKYLPGDTVRFKAFLVNRRGRPVNRPLKVSLERSNKNLVLITLKPYRKGGYEYQFFLHDSLRLDLDNSYFISLCRNERKVYERKSFKYEDYELTKNKLSLRLDEKEHFLEKDILLYAKGTDENDLNLPDASLEILVKPDVINKFFDDHTFIPDTIAYFERKLEPSGETTITITDSVFPKANFDYIIQARMLSSDNEVITEKTEVKYFRESERFEAELLRDSIAFRYKKNGITLSKNAEIFSVDNFGNLTSVYKGTVPATVALLPYYASYKILADSLSETINIAAKPSLLKCYSDRTSDSIHIVVDNPRKIPFSYNIYKKNASKTYGADSINFKESVGRQDYYVSIRYLWGGKIKEENFRIPLNEKKLNVRVQQPKIVYPGQKTKIDVFVTDYKGKPVEGVDLTAYSLAKKFDYSGTDVPDLAKFRRGKALINNFSFRQSGFETHADKYLDYKTWRLRAGLDSIEYYRFLYPETIYRFEYKNPDSVTEFAPFVIKGGFAQPVHVIYSDNKPVYFSWSTNQGPYSFRIDSGYHQIKLRTAHNCITIDRLYFKPGMKTIFSLNANLHDRNVRIENAMPILSLNEQNSLYNYIFPYKNTFGERMAFIQSDSSIQLLSNQNRYIWNNFAGPVSGTVTFNLADSFSKNFVHEPYYEYEFSPETIKMRNTDTKQYPKNLYSYDVKTSLNDHALTERSIREQWKAYIDSKRYITATYRYPTSTSPGYGRLFIDLTRKGNPVKDLPLNILVFRYDNHEFLRVYPGNTSLINQLDRGFHRLIFFYSGARYHIRDSVFVNVNGLNHYYIEQPEVFRKDSFSIHVSELIEKTIFRPGPQVSDEEKELRQIYNMYQQQFRYTGAGKIIEGYVRDKQTQEPLPGVTIVVQGTTFGTVTDINGYYSINMPAGDHVLDFSFVGYVSEERSTGTDILNVNMSPDILHLDEVVVVGYGTTKKANLTGSVSVVSTTGIPGVSGNLTGRMAGVSIQSSSKGVEIRIRGASPIQLESKPLYIINGVVFTGDISELDPQLIEHIEVLKDPSVTAMYGAKGANGVVIIETKSGAFKVPVTPAAKGAEYDDSFLEAASQANSIRKNFSDYAFWKPALTTDNEGKAGFEVTFPDDVTSWETYYLAMNGSRQSGQASSVIKSYKPLMAQLATPRFLVESDTASVIGKVLNYMPDSVEVTTKMETDNQVKTVKNRFCVNSVIDTSFITASSDSVTIKYSLEKEDGYFDGEQRIIPVYPLGLEKSKGNFYVLDRDTTVKLSFDQSLGEVNIYAKADVLDVMEDEINHVMGYLYSCNEQVASKLKALIAAKYIAMYKGEKFRSDHEIEKLIRILKNNRKENGLWGWWKDSEESEWISLHVLEALVHAERFGFNSRIEIGDITARLIWELQSTRDFYARVRILKILNLLNVSYNYKSAVTDLEKTKNLSLNGRLQIALLKQMTGIKINPDSVLSLQKTTIFGNVFFADETEESGLLVNERQNTLLAYRILKGDTLNDHRETLRKIRNYFLEERKSGYWDNTYESAQIIETILPDLLGKKSELRNPGITLRGDVNRTVKEFPFQIKLNPDQNIEISKSGDLPVYLTCYQKYWNKDPEVTKGDFEIITHFENNPEGILKAGKEVTLIASVLVKKDAEYVMINIPVPAGCSYADKKNNLPGESHREYFRNETAIFCEYLPKGNYQFRIQLIPRYTGSYILNPAKVELMYFPVFHANTKIKQTYIK